MKKTFNKKDIELLNKFEALLDEEALMLLYRINNTQINEGRVCEVIPLLNITERKNADLIKKCLSNWLYKNKYGLEYLTKGKITYIGTFDLSYYNFH